MSDQTCANCGESNPERAAFCMNCGSALAARCSNCGTENPPGARFCMKCGNGLVAADADQPGAEATAGPAQHPEERRNASVLFADLSGYTAVAEHMDPEAVKSMVDGALQRLAREVDRFGGHVDKFIGDNVMAVFGAPVAHEDDPERAVRAGLGMQEAMAEINASLVDTAGVSFSLRVGINSGEVLAGAVGETYTVIGDSVNVASRLEAAAEPGSVTVGEPTWRATRHAITYEELEPLTLKGKSQPVSAWRALAVSGGDEQEESARLKTPLFGREDESALLASLYERAVADQRPHLVTMIGAPGVGKSRLLRELIASLNRDENGPEVLIGRAPPYSASPYWALGEMLRQHFEILDADDSAAAWEKLTTGLSALPELADQADEMAAALALPLGIEPPATLETATHTRTISTAAAELDHDATQQLRDRLFSAVRSFVEATSRQRPMICAVEDIHWAEEGMLDLVEHLARSVRGPVLIVCAGRDELLDRRPTWGGGRRNATTISLTPLPPNQVEQMVSGLLAEGNGDPVNGQDALAARVAERSGGNPLFAEELVNRIREEGGEDSRALPESVQSVLAARLDALPRDERQLLQHAAVVGERFWEGSMTAVAAEQGIDIDAALNSLQDRDLIVSSAGSRLAGEQEYAFKHSLIRDVAYERLPKALRARRHAEVGRFIEQRAGDRSEAVIALVADHAARAAGLGAEAQLPAGELADFRVSAAEHLEAAGDHAAALHSNEAALRHLTKALEIEGLSEVDTARVGEKHGDVAFVLGRVDAALEIWRRCLDYRQRQEDLPRIGDLHRKIGTGLWAKGESSDAIGHYQQGIDLLKGGPDSIELVYLYEEAASLYMHTGDNLLAIHASERAIKLAASLDEPGAASRAHGIFGRVFGRIGDAEKAVENLERSVELAKQSGPREAVVALLALGSHRELSEASAAAADAYSEALALADQVGDLPAQVEIHAALGRLAARRADWAAAELAEQASSALIEREGLVGLVCFPELIRGWIRWRDGELDLAITTLENARDLGEEVGRMEVVFPASQLVGWVLSGRGDYERASVAFAEALEVCERAGLTAQSVEACAARAVNLGLADRGADAADALHEAEHLAERLSDPAGNAAVLDARGALSEDPAGAAATLASAGAAWREVGRPLESARSELLRALRLAAAGDPQAAESRDAAIAGFTDHGYGHMAKRAEALIVLSTTE